ncbi:hypothetical protein R1sor_013310 [Riccia sorocarpa]|uniref:Uncharacterized protein n=1 Tax=Riccia sorocarpa TaxID=122646 RepID=A0ABD3H870_9MARC
MQPLKPRLLLYKDLDDKRMTPGVDCSWQKPGSTSLGQGARLSVGQSCMVQFTVMANDRPSVPPVKLDWKGEGDEYWDVSGGELHEAVTVYPHELRQQFPLFAAAASAVAKEEQWQTVFDDDLQLLGCAAYALAYSKPRMQRFHVYRAIARSLGYSDPTQLPELLKNAVKKQWPEPTGEYVGYIP